MRGQPRVRQLKKKTKKTPSSLHPRVSRGKQPSKQDSSRTHSYQSQLPKWSTMRPGIRSARAITRAAHLTRAQRAPIGAARSPAAILNAAAFASESRGSPWLPQCTPRLSSTARLLVRLTFNAPSTRSFT